MSLVIILHILVLCKCKAQVPFGDEEAEARHELGLYKNLQEVLNIFRRDPSPIAKQIIDTYLSVCRYTEEPVLTEERRKPFIVIEGNHRSSQYPLNGETQA
ncbi:uncharacterized protein LOC129001009 [Macrosteles quadrilineatus]|uniref:uncharacterized protein LOC129001009 n=1 Tax=Macrosteles quadrilineatus TaxID=74068 RepID=UPI0023E16299|nr:uncharacterized protein LOC129001009 [Macrosteles quadrilineatus]